MQEKRIEEFLKMARLNKNQLKNTNKED